MDKFLKDSAKKSIFELNTLLESCELNDDKVNFIIDYLIFTLDNLNALDKIKFYALASVSGGLIGSINYNSDVPIDGLIDKLSMISKDTAIRYVSNSRSGKDGDE